MTCGASLCVFLGIRIPAAICNMIGLEHMITNFSLAPNNFEIKTKFQLIKIRSKTLETAPLRTLHHLNQDIPVHNSANWISDSLIVLLMIEQFSE